MEINDKPSALKGTEGKAVSNCGDVCLVIPDKLLGLEAAKLTEIGEYLFKQRGCSRLCV